MPVPTPSTDIVLAQPTTNERERLALAGFLAGYSGLTRDAYALDLRQFLAWCTGHGTHLFAARRADPGFKARVQRIIKEDRELLERLAK